MNFITNQKTRTILNISILTLLVINLLIMLSMLIQGLGQKVTMDETGAHFPSIWNMEKWVNMPVGINEMSIPSLNTSAAGPALMITVLSFGAISVVLGALLLVGDIKNGSGILSISFVGVVIVLNVIILALGAVMFANAKGMFDYKDVKHAADSSKFFLGTITEAKNKVLGSSSGCTIVLIVGTITGLVGSGMTGFTTFKTIKG